MRRDSLIIIDMLKVFNRCGEIDSFLVQYKCDNEYEEKLLKKLMHEWASSKDNFSTFLLNELKDNIIGLSNQANMYFNW